MAKLSEYVKQTSKHKLTVCLTSAEDNIANRYERFIVISFNDKHGHASGLVPCDFGLPGIVRGFDREMTRADTCKCGMILGHESACVSDNPY